VLRERDDALFALGREEPDRLEAPLLRFALEDVDLVVAIYAISSSLEDGLSRAWTTRLAGQLASGASRSTKS
jgi:hypothetical protein